MRIRGVLKNESGKLVPGMFARLSVPGSGRYHAVLVPDTAIGNDQSQRNLLVVDKENKVAVRPVKLGALFGGLRSIVSGIGPEDRIVVNGQMHARPGIGGEADRSENQSERSRLCRSGCGDREDESRVWFKFFCLNDQRLRGTQALV